MVNKRGLFFWTELVFIVMIVVLIALNISASKEGFFKMKNAVDLEKLGFGALQNLDQSRILENFTNAESITSSNFTALSLYIKESLPSTVEANIEYFDGASCLSESGGPLASCGNVTLRADTAVASYTFTRLRNPVTIKLYLWSVFS